MTPDRTPSEATVPSDLTLLNAVANLAARATSTQELLDGCLDLIERCLATSSSLIRLLDPEAGDLFLAAARGIPDGYLRSYPRIALGERISGRAARDGRPLVLSDGDRTNPFLSSLRGTGLDVTEMACIPLQAGRSLIGVLCLYRGEGRPFTEQEVALLTTVGQYLGVALQTRHLLEDSQKEQEEMKRIVREQAALAAENARLHEETLQGKKYLETILEINKRIGTTPQINDLLQIIADEAARLLQVEGTGFRVVEGDFLALAATSGIARHIMLRPRLRIGESLSGQVAAENRPIIVNGIAAASTMIKEHQDAAISLGITSALFVPVQIRNRVIGVLSIQTTADRHFTQSEVDRATVFADQAAIALENARLFEETNRRNRELQALYTVTNTITQSLEIEPLLERALTKTIEVLHVDAGRLYVWDENTHLLRLSASHGLPVEELSNLESYAPGEGIIGKIFEENRAHVFADMAHDPTYEGMARGARGKKWGFRSSTGLPITVKERPVGVIYVYGRSVREFSPQDLELLTAIGRQIGAALDNARLFAETERRAREQAVLHTTASTFNQSTDLEATLDVVLDAVLKFTSADAASLRLMNTQSDQMDFVINRGFSEEYLDQRRSVKDIGKAAQQVLSTGNAVISGDLEHDPLFQGGMLVRSGFRSAIYLSIKAKDKILGILNLASRTLQRFDRRERDTLVAISHQLGAALENARLFAETNWRNRELQALYTVTAAVSGSLDIKQVLDKALDTVLQVTGLEAGFIRLLDGEPPRLTFKAHKGISPAFVEKLQRGPRVGGKAEQVISTKRSLISDIQHPETRPSRTLQEGFTASALIPITSQETVVGIINVATRKSPTFPRDQVALLESIGASLGVAFERARLYAEVTEHAATLEAKVLERTRELEEASRHKSEFLANMSHELRTPLNAVIGFSEVLEDATFGPLNPKQTRYVQNIHSSGQHLLRLINDILDLSKVEAGKMEIRPEEVGLRGAIEEVVAALKPLAEKKHLPLAVELEAGTSALLADPGKVRQILYNLLSNAVKFTPEGGTVTVAARRYGPDPRLVEIAVTDTGVGIAPADLPRLFQEFVQLDSSVAKQYQGTGLGLALTKKLVELHGGTIAATSPGPGRGTTFTVTLPSPGLLSAGSDTPDPTALPVLVIEDDPKAINLLAVHLTQAGYAVAVARDAAEALAKARTLQPFAITLDILMPGTDGWGILQALKADPVTREIPVIIVSIVEDQKFGLTLGALEYLVKPLKKEALLRILDRLTLSPRVRGRPLTVLVVDDEPSIRELLGALLTPLGVTVLTAGGGAEGIARAREAQPDLLILDLMMPEVSGFEVVKTLRADPATAALPIVINTAKILTAAEQGELTQQIQALFQKGSYTPEVLLRELARIARGRGGRP